jgi:hypothetical protein
MKQYCSMRTFVWFYTNAFFVGGKAYSRRSVRRGPGRYVPYKEAANESTFGGRKLLRCHCNFGISCDEGLKEHIIVLTLNA